MQLCYILIVLYEYEKASDIKLQSITLFTSNKIKTISYCQMFIFIIKHSGGCGFDYNSAELITYTKNVVSSISVNWQ